MRRCCLWMSVVALGLATFPGCQQAASPTAGAMVSPLGSPATPGIGAGTAPPATPFGGSTRVVPPSTGYATPNNYLGGVAPNSTSMTVPASPIGAPAGQMGEGPIGSGVATASYLADGNLPHSPSTKPPSPVASYSGGMAVNDFTDAPPPPGYRGQPPMTPAYTNTRNPMGVVPNVGANTNAFGQTFPSPTPAAPGFAAQPLNASPPAVGGSMAMTDGSPAIPEAHQSWGSPADRQASLPSTDPVSGSANVASEQNLPWRKPAPRY